MRIPDRKSFAVGLAMLVAFTFVLVFGIAWRRDGRSLLNQADETFNGLAKASAHSSNNVAARVGELRDGAFTATVEIKTRPENVEAILTKAGCAVKRQGSAMEVAGNLSALARAVLTDCDEMHENRGEGIRARYGLPEREAMYCWWSALGQVSRQLKAQGRLEESELALDLVTQRVEPAYNFYGVEAGEVGGRPLAVAGLLVLYVAYTLWYGMGIYLVCKGLGLRADRPKPKAPGS